MARVINTYIAGSDQFQIISSTRQSNSFVVLEDSVINCGVEDCIHDWDIVLFSKRSDGIKKSWYIKGIVTRNSSVELTFPTFSNLSSSKGVLCSDKIYILDQTTGILYSLDISVVYCEDNNRNDAPKNVMMNKVSFSTNEMKIRDISSSGKDCFAIDFLSGIYKVPDLLCRMDGVHPIKIFSGFAFNLLLTDTGAVYSWGNGSRGELGQRNVKLSCEVPSRVDFFDDLPSIVTSVACGGWHSLALTSDGDVYSWGWNESGQLGHSGEKLSAVNIDPYPIDIGSSEDPVEMIGAGSRHSLAVLKSGSVLSWGCNRFGQLGVGDTENRTIPTETVGILADHQSNSDLRLHCGRWLSMISCIKQ